MASKTDIKWRDVSPGPRRTGGIHARGADPGAKEPNTPRRDRKSERREFHRAGVGFDQGSERRPRRIISSLPTRSSGRPALRRKPCRVISRLGYVQVDNKYHFPNNGAPAFTTTRQGLLPALRIPRLSRTCRNRQGAWLDQHCHHGNQDPSRPRPGNRQIWRPYSSRIPAEQLEEAMLEKETGSRSRITTCRRQRSVAPVLARQSVPRQPTRRELVRPSTFRSRTASIPANLLERGRRALPTTPVGIPFRTSR